MKTFPLIPLIPLALGTRISSKITVPMVSPLMLVCWIYTIVDFFMKTDNKIMGKINEQMIVQLNYGYSSALAWIYFIVCMVLIGISSLIISKVVYNYD